MTLRPIDNFNLLSKVFSYLDFGFDNARVLRVSKRWKQIASNQWLHARSLDVRQLFHAKIPKKYAKALASILKKCTQLQSVVLGKPPETKAFRLFFRYLPLSVRDLNLLPAYPYNPLMSAEEAPPITHLSLATEYEDTLTFARKVPNVTDLKVFGEVDLRSLIEELRQLKSLEIVGPFKAQIVRDHQEILDLAAPHLALTHLKLICCFVDERLIRFLARVFPSLKSLNFESCVGPKESALLDAFRPEEEKGMILVRFNEKEKAAEYLKSATEK